ncbi:lysozyme inhibitor LprI family protein [Shinella curvata]|uniref:Lysozyme inhibitor LprI family protein n=1 Tax=Shinella curvata TaxID=1817964 RepID=A0ABT8XD95_9HYPH|nr:lysozyme inhibitor LprI family protein [Shinella curvata]MCJ8055234.1 lysozyme inhibitor LprI family protein [Shinella curvata]MDO6121651.1 lysozyme inhibitor LprI family protein [Shinella curvata]
MPIHALLQLAAAAFLLSASVSAAQEADIDCENAMTQMEMNICADRDYKDADVALNAAYKKALSAARETDDDVRDLGENYVGAVDALKRAQRAWIGYRDGQCEFAGFGARGGSMEPLLVSSCLADLTRKRTDELKAGYEQEN